MRSHPNSHLGHQEHSYTVHTHPPEARRALQCKEQVHFDVFDIDIPGYPRPAPEYLPLPDARFLALHAACCKVAHMSGAAERIEKVVRDMGELQVLAEDGGSADVLIYAMSRLVAHPSPDRTPVQAVIRGAAS